MSALYIHIPFCKTRCNYCDFYKQTQLIDPSLYFNALEREMEFRRDFFAPGEPLRTVYFGGGTPSVYPPSFLQSVLDKAVVKGVVHRNTAARRKASITAKVKALSA